MRSRILRLTTLVLSGLLLAACARPAGGDLVEPFAVQSRFDLDQELELAPEIQTGTLDNGLTWFVRPHGSPPGRVELRLAVDVGSVVERDDERGFAHAVEHMAFNGTEQYPGTSLVTWLEGQGIPFGVHINAHTGFDETVYELQIPTDDPAVVDQAIGVLAEWAGHVTFEPAEVAAEKGVIIEEWRTGEGVQARIREALLDAIFAGSIYSERPPIGTEASLRGLDAAELRAFYDRWYRPDLMGVMVVGDVDADHVKQVIAEEFSDLDMPSPVAQRPRPLLPDHAKPRVAVVADPEAPGTVVSLFSRVAQKEENTLGAYRDWIVGLTVQTIVEDRLRVLHRGTEGAVVRTELGGGRLTPAYTALSATAYAQDPDRALEALEALCVEVDRLRTHGIQEPELVRAIRKMKTVQRQIAARAAGGETPSGELADELVRHYLTDEPAPDFEEMARISESLLDEVTTREASAWLDRFVLPPDNRAIQIVVPAEVGPSETAVLDAYRRGFAGEPEPLEDVNIDRPLVSEPPEPGEIAARETVPGTDAVRWTLANGATVLFQRRTTQPQRVVLRGRSPGGVTKGDPAAGFLGIPVTKLSGLGEHEPVIMAKIMAGRDVELDLDLGALHEGVEGQAGVDELDALFTLTWLRLTRSRFEEEALLRSKRFLAQALEPQRTVPENVAVRTAESLYWKGQAGFTLPEPDTLDAVTLEEVEQTVGGRLESFHDWTFVIVGDVTVDEVEPLVARWLASLPGEPGPDESLAPLEGHPDGVVTERVELGRTERAMVDLRLYTPVEDTSLEHQAVLNAMTGVFSVRLRNALREKLGGTYVPMVRGYLEQEPSALWVQSIRFQCDPARVDELRAAVSSEMERLVEEGPTEEEVETQRRLQVRGWELDQRQLDVWASAVMRAETLGVPLADVLDVEGRAAAIDVDAVQAAAAAHLVETPRVEVVLVPESSDGVE